MNMLSQHNLIRRNNYYSVADLVFDTKNQPWSQITRDQMNVVVKTEAVSTFVKQFDQHARHDMLLHVIDDPVRSTDRSINRQIIPIIDDSRVIRCFCDGWVDHPHDKVTPMPIGMPSKRHYVHAQQQMITSPSRCIDIDSKMLKASITFHHELRDKRCRSGFSSGRKQAKNILQSNPDVQFMDRMSPIEYLQHHERFAFTVSPFGNGADCHRTWEALFMNTIPIVKTSLLDGMYKFHDVPVVIVDDWHQITRSNMKNWLQQLKHKLSDRYLLVDHYRCG